MVIPKGIARVPIKRKINYEDQIRVVIFLIIRNRACRLLPLQSGDSEAVTTQKWASAPPFRKKGRSF